MMKLYALDNKFIEESNVVPSNFTGVVQLHGSKIWYLNGRCHRLDGPAIERSNGSKAWFVNGKRHRIDGPAIEWSGGATSWYICDIECTPESFNLLKDVMKLKGLTTVP